MLRYLISKSFYGVLVLFGVVTLIFLIFNSIPGDPVRMMLGQRTDRASIQAVEKEIGRDLPFLTQYLRYLNDLSPVSFHTTTDDGNHFYFDKSKYSSFGKIVLDDNRIIAFKWPYLGRSYQSKKRVADIIMETLPLTLILAFAAIFIAFVVGIFLGIIGAVRQDTFLDKALLFAATIGMSGPSFFVAIILAWLFGFVLTDITGLSMTGSLYEIDDFGRGKFLTPAHLILPAITLGIRPLSVIMQLMRNSLLDVIGNDYIRTARAKGLPEWQVIGRHALKNALNPVVTAVSGWFAGMLAGAVFVEMVFAWKGIGWEMVNALEKYDLPVVMGAVLAISFIFVVLNMVVDILYTYLDPRIKLES